MAPSTSVHSMDNARAAFEGSIRERALLAACRDAGPALLVLLAADEAEAVRQAVAQNPAAPRPADGVLARDAVALIRASLARKLASQAAELASCAQDMPAAWQPLQRLAGDASPQVRFAVADVLADLPGAPHALVHALARDPALAVSEPVIRLSPVLTESDLMALIRNPPAAESRVTVARRLGLPRDVAEAVVASGDMPSLRALLRNPTARLPAGRLAMLRAIAAPNDQPPPTTRAKVHVIEPS